MIIVNRSSCADLIKPSSLDPGEAQRLQIGALETH
jgi:hypothetical protein